MSETAIETRRLVQLVSSLVLLVACAAFFVYGGMSALMLFLAAAALALTIYFLWRSLSTVDRSEDMDFEEALSLAAPSATEEQKRAILRTLKDLEYELSVGKISQEDFDQLSAEYRAEAKRLIYLADEELRARMKKAERIVEQRLAKRSTKKKSKKSKGPALGDKSAAASSTAAPTAGRDSSDPGPPRRERGAEPKEPSELPDGPRDDAKEPPGGSSGTLSSDAADPPLKVGGGDR